MLRIVFCIVLCLIPLSSFAQITGFHEDFNDNTLTNWRFDNSTFTLSETRGVLHIDYHRTAASGEWHTFHLIRLNIDAGLNTHIQVKAKSTVSTQITLKPIYSNGADSRLLQERLPADNAWHTYTFGLVQLQDTTITRIYFFLDGGSTTPVSGSVWLDDLRIGERVSVDIDRSELEQAIIDATALLNNSEEGSSEGQLAPGSKAVLQSVVDKEQLVLNDETASQLQIDRAVSNLYDACHAFEAKAIVRNISVADQSASKETKYLFSSLMVISNNHLLFGHQDTTAYGVGWWDEDEKSDINDVCGSFSAVYGWDIGLLELGSLHNLDGVNFDRMRFWIRAAYERGGINTISWHSTNPVSGGAFTDVTKAVSHILPGGAYHDNYKAGLDRLAHFFKSLRAAAGNSIPVIFRPFHGSGFWWGKNHCTAEEFISLWQFTVEYLRKEKGVHNLLYAYSPFSYASDTRDKYMKRYPGDHYVDVLGVTIGFLTHNKEKGLQHFRMIARLAREKNKIAAITTLYFTTLYLNLDNENCWTEFLNSVKNDPLAKDVAWMLVWRNLDTYHFFAPYPGHASVPDFLKFYNDPFTIFESRLPDMYAPSELNGKPRVDGIASWRPRGNSTSAEPKTRDALDAAATTSEKSRSFLNKFAATILVVALVAGLIQIISMWTLFEKGGHTGWVSLVPFYNMWVLAEIGDRPGYVGLIMCFIGFIPLVGVLIGLALWIFISLGVAKTFGRGVFFGIGLSFLPLIFYPILAFTKG